LYYRDWWGILLFMHVVTPLKHHALLILWFALISQPSRIESRSLYCLWIRWDLHPQVSASIVGFRLKLVLFTDPSVGFRISNQLLLTHDPQAGSLPL